MSSIKSPLISVSNNSPKMRPYINRPTTHPRLPSDCVLAVESEIGVKANHSAIRRWRRLWVRGPLASVRVINVRFEAIVNPLALNCGRWSRRSVTNQLGGRVSQGSEEDCQISQAVYTCALLFWAMQYSFIYSEDFYSAPSRRRLGFACYPNTAEKEVFRWA